MFIAKRRESYARYVPSDRALAKAAGKRRAKRAAVPKDELREQDRARYLKYRTQEQARARSRERARREADPLFAKKRYAANRAHFVRKALEWARAHPDARVAIQNRRQARKRAALGRGISAGDLLRMRDEQLGLCCYCAERLPLTIDHVEPLSRGGADDPDNAVMACRSCNASKNNQPLIVFLARRVV